MIEKVYIALVDIIIRVLNENLGDYFRVHNTNDYIRRVVVTQVTLVIKKGIPKILFIINFLTKEKIDIEH